MRKIGVGVIGLGDFGERHVQAIKSIPYAELVAVCSRSERRAKEIAQGYGVKRWYTDRGKIVEDKDVDVVTIATADDDHAEPTILAAEAGKHILLEKPIATTLEDADKIISTTKRTGVIFMVGHILRFDRRYRVVREMRLRGELGEIISVYARRLGSSDAADRFLNRVSPIVQHGVHDIDIIRWILGGEVKTVYAKAVKFREYRYPDAYWTIMEFEDKRIGVVESGFVLPSTYPHFIDSFFELVSENAAIHIYTPGELFTVYHNKYLSKPDVTYWPQFNLHAEGALRDEIEYFLQCVHSEIQPNLIVPEDARRALEIALAGEKSALSGSSVTL
ncbi:MAG: Gfo/Idh/MocA family oxidoreductase [Nitrososphaerota archaeon]